MTPPAGSYSVTGGHEIMGAPLRRSDPSGNRRSMLWTIGWSRPAWPAWTRSSVDCAWATTWSGGSMTLMTTAPWLPRSPLQPWSRAAGWCTSGSVGTPRCWIQARWRWSMTSTPYRGFESFTARGCTPSRPRRGAGPSTCSTASRTCCRAWATDAMIGNFFLVTCPYLFELDTVAYFALLRGSHSFKTIARIREHHAGADGASTGATTQLYVHPIKVWRPLLADHVPAPPAHGEAFVPLTSSFDATNPVHPPAQPAARHRAGPGWTTGTGCSSGPGMLAASSPTGRRRPRDGGPARAGC